MSQKKPFEFIPFYAKYLESIGFTPEDPDSPDEDLHDELYEIIHRHLKGELPQRQHPPLPLDFGPPPEPEE